MTIEEQANMVARVKTTESHIIENPISVDANARISEIKSLQKKHNIKTILVFLINI